MKNYLRPGTMTIELPADDDVITMLVETKRIRWSQKADMLAVSKAISKLFEDMWLSGLSPEEFVRREKIKCRHD